MSNPRNSSSGNHYEKLKNGSYESQASMTIKDKIQRFNQSINNQKEDNSSFGENKKCEMQNNGVIMHKKDQPLSMMKSTTKYESQRKYAAQPNVIKQRAATINQNIKNHSAFKNDTPKNEINNLNVNDEKNKKKLIGMKEKNKQDDQYENDDSDDCICLTQNDDDDEDNKSAMIKQLNSLYVKRDQYQNSNPLRSKSFGMRSQKDIVQDYLNEIDLPAVEHKIYETSINKDSIPKEYLPEIQEQTKDIPKDKIITYKKQSYSYTIHDISTYGMNDNITYVGAFLKVKIDGNQIIPINNLKRKPLKLSLKLESSSNYDLKVETVNDICLSNIRIAINNLVKAFSQKKIQIPLKLSTKLIEIRTKEDININLGIAFKCQPIFDISSKFDFDSKSNKTFALLIMKQVYFTINADYGNDGAFSLLSDDVTEFDIKRAISKDEIPVYVSSVCYGCLIVISIQTSQSFNELENELNVDSGFSFNAKSSLKKLNDNARYSCDFYINGGSEKLKKAIKEYNMKKILKHLCNVDDQERNLGIPIFYQLSKIDDNIFVVIRPNLAVDTSPHKYGTFCVVYT